MIIWLASYPRSGNTFIRTILNHSFGIKTYSVYGDKFDIAADAETSKIVGHEDLPSDFDYNEARDSSGLYFIKTHEPFGINHEKDKAIVIVRDGREATVSFYHYYMSFTSIRFDYLQIINGHTFIGTWSDHFFSWNKADKNNVLRLSYEKSTSSLSQTIEQISAFIGVKPIKQKVPDFKTLHQINPEFFRSGKMNTFTNELTQYEQKYFWLVNGRGMQAAKYIDRVPSFDDDIETIQLFFSHIELCGKNSERVLGRMIDNNRQHLRQLIEQLYQQEKVISSKKDLIDQLQKSLATKDTQLHEKTTEIKNLGEIINKKSNQLEEKDELISKLNVQIKLKEKLVSDIEMKLIELYKTSTNQSIKINQLTEILKKVEASYTFRIGKTIMWPVKKIAGSRHG